MKAMSFGCNKTDLIYTSEVLPSLLNKTKQGTLRPVIFDKAWCPICKKIVPENEIAAVVIRSDGNLERAFHYPNCKGKGELQPFRVPQYKVGDKVIAYWKQRGTPPNSLFCGNCGGILPIKEADDRWLVCWDGEHREWIAGRSPDERMIPFPKTLGTIRITGVYEISVKKMMHDDKNYLLFTPRGVRKRPFRIWEDGEIWANQWGRKLIEKEGFAQSKSMFLWFNSRKNLNLERETILENRQFEWI